MVKFLSLKKNVIMENILSIKIQFNYFVTSLFVLTMVIGLQKGSIAENSLYFDNDFHEFTIELDSAQDVRNQERIIYTEVDEMPRFPGCEFFLGDKEERIKCAEGKMARFIYPQIRYPSEARERGIQGEVIATFVVTEQGWIDDIRIIQRIGGGCEEEVVRVISLMNEMKERWIPGKVNGRNVNTLYEFPVRFTLH